ncbi:HD-GYP domain-containing protein [Dongshaea marina]|uniref:HD-GYP domain-containing protein n=1 Tax=Dongshaea marina TaxID=2047966 RepID=UPI000D3E14C6|nr:HD-GYP domain-containing protein [Dongshaea marina]
MKECQIEIKSIRIGNYIRLPDSVDWTAHPFLFRSFKVKSADQIAIIRGLGIDHVFLIPEKSDSKSIAEAKPKEVKERPAKPVEEEVAEAVKEPEEEAPVFNVKEYKKTLGKAEDGFRQTLSEVRNLMGKVQSQPLVVIKEANKMVEDISNKLMSADGGEIFLMSDTKERADIHFHSLNIAILAMMLGREVGLSPDEMCALGVGALFHDIGKLKVPTPILRKTEPLTPPEMNLLKEHTRYGTELLKLAASKFPRKAKRIVAQHHEMLDGSGYPDGLTWDDIDPLAQIVSVVNEYDNLCHNADVEKAKLPSAALSYLYKNYSKKLNLDYLTMMIRLLGVYPPGSVVQLSDGRFGLVMSVNSARLLYPRVLVYDFRVPSEEAPIVDLEVQGLTIANAMQPQQLPDIVYEYLSPRTRICYFFASSVPAASAAASVDKPDKS